MPTQAVSLAAVATATASTVTGDQVLNSVNQFHDLYSGAWTALAAGVVGFTGIVGVLVPALISYQQSRRFAREIEMQLAAAKVATDKTIKDMVDAARKDLEKIVKDQDDLVAKKITATETTFTGLLADANTSLAGAVAALEGKAAEELTKVSELHRTELQAEIKNLSAQLLAVEARAQFHAGIQSQISGEWHLARFYFCSSIVKSVKAGEAGGPMTAAQSLLESIPKGNWDEDDAKYVALGINALKRREDPDMAKLARNIHAIATKRQIDTFGSLGALTPKKRLKLRRGAVTSHAEPPAEPKPPQPAEATKATDGPK